ncbi:Gamma-aminobutyric acid type B receptor subunit 2 [Trichoplax sp. H2]|nr:Gamma-aminobutyric acid type B receptor subunit 2 [Trichoplax sp. H2]|eukprot:RDD36126.1 Gamma-aminobutyric acid type B receptor subunit 2 [Trichoplax sp. H2]
MRLAIWICFFFIFGSMQECLCQKNLTIICLIPFMSPNSASRFLYTAARTAVRDVNQANNILSNYQLQIEFHDGQGDGPLTTKLLIDAISRSPTKIAIIGPLLSTAAEYVASISKYWNLVQVYDQFNDRCIVFLNVDLLPFTQVGYASTSISLDDRSTYPYYFRTSVTEQSYIPARMKFFKYFNWNKAGIVHSSFGTYPKLALLVKQEMSKENIEVAVVESIDKDGTFAVNSLKGDGPLTTKLLIDTISRSPTKIAIIGPLLSTAAEYVASISKYWNLVQVGYASTSISLDDRSTYPYYFRTSVTEQSYIPARMTFFKHFNWKKAGIVHSSFGTYPKLALLVKQEMSKENIEVAVVESIDRDGTFAVNSLKAYHKGYYGSKYVWWFPGWFRSNWWRDTYGTYNCSSNEIFEVIGNNSFYTTTPIYSTSNTTAVSGKVI